jgi:hypothetical protein
MPSRVRAALCLAALFAAAPAAAQPSPPAAENGDIVVKAPEQAPPSNEDVNRQARAVTQGGDFLHSPLARFEDPLCPGILGLKPDYAAIMIDRMRAAAELFGLWLADDSNCRPNLIVAFVDDGKAELAELAQQHPESFIWMDTYDRKQLPAEDGPVRVWTTAVMRTRDGMAIARRDSLDNPPVANMWMAHSKIYLPVRQDINQVVVFYDRAAVKGKTLVQLADYATMRGLARTRSAREGAAMDTILTLFDPAASPPGGLTEFDRAYLASLYDGIPNLPASAKIGGVNRQLRRQAAAEQEREE